ncbi:MFS transporter [Arthrobacter sp. TWP1-1]|uniref:MFS transporter n=1 Tax=Arthrobacter sp. TWP1-1 TaxID=2804568 RepID=UPI003CE7F109
MSISSVRLVPSIAVEMNVPVSTAQWMLTINLLAGAMATPVMGRISDGPHRKQLLLVALSLILIGSIIAAVAPNFTILLIGRAFQGLRYGIVPFTISLARRHVPATTVQATGQGVSLNS